MGKTERGKDVTDVKCERCRFAPPADSEGFQDECGLFEKYGTVWKDGSYGCTMNYQTLQKLEDEHMADMGNMGEDMGVEMDFDNRGWKIDDAISVMMHMIGMFPEGARKTYKRHGKVFYRPYRNYFAGQNKYLDYFSGSLGLCEKWEGTGSTVENGVVKGKPMPYYALTRTGLNFLGRHTHVSIYDEED